MRPGTPWKFGEIAQSLVCFALIQQARRAASCKMRVARLSLVDIPVASPDLHGCDKNANTLPVPLDSRGFTAAQPDAAFDRFCKTYPCQDHDAARPYLCQDHDDLVAARPEFLAEVKSGIHPDVIFEQLEGIYKTVKQRDR